MNESKFSVSKGVFTYRGKKKRMDQNYYATTDNNIEFDTNLRCIERIHIFENLWQHIHKEIKNIQNNLNSQVFSELIEYLTRCQINFKLSKEETRKTGITNLEYFTNKYKNCNEIPAAALITGVNIPDHADFFANLIGSIRKQVTPHVVLLTSNKCSNIKNIICETVLQLIENKDEVDLDLILEEDENKSTTFNSHTFLDFNSKTKLPTMKLVADWYYNLYKDNILRNQTSTSCNNLKKFETPKKSTQSSENIEGSSSSKKKSDKNIMKHSPNKIIKVDINSFDIKKDLISSLTLSSDMTLSSPSKNHNKPNYSSSRKKSLTNVNFNNGYNLEDKEATKLNNSLTSPNKYKQLSRITTDISNNIDLKNKIYLESSHDKPVLYQSHFLPVVIVLEDFEGFVPHVIQDFITILSYHLKNIPIALIFGIATTISVIHRFLPYAVSSKLSMEKFQSVYSSSHFSEVLDKLLMTDKYQFKLDSKSFNFLLDSFLFNDFSVQNFIRSLKFAMLKHFCLTPSSWICSNFTELELIVQELNCEMLNAIRNTSSFRRYIECCAPEMQIKLLEDDSYAKNHLVQLIISHRQYHSSFFPILYCLHILSSNIPSSPLGKTQRELYSMCLSENIYETASYEKALELIRSTYSRNELLSCLEKVIIKLKTSQFDEMFKTTIFKGLIFDVCRFITELKNIEEYSSLTDDNVFNENDTKESLTLPKKIDMFSLKQILKEKDKSQKIKSVFEILRINIIDYFHNLFKKYLCCPKSLALYDATYFRGSDLLKQHFMATPRSVLQKALSDPKVYLKNENLTIKNNQITAELPDTCIVYKLHLECGKLINLYDWLQAFISILESEKDSNDDESTNLEDKDGINKVLQARFIRAISELQFMGFIKPTNRKTDHVARLTWGAV